MLQRVTTCRSPFHDTDTFQTRARKRGLLDEKFSVAASPSSFPTARSAIQTVFRRILKLFLNWASIDELQLLQKFHFWMKVKAHNVMYRYVCVHTHTYIYRYECARVHMCRYMCRCTDIFPCNGFQRQTPELFNFLFLVYLAVNRYRIIKNHYRSPFVLFQIY